ncbi:unnamed protein product [Chrysoparadoxa australica]
MGDDESYGMEEISDEEKLTIAKHILMNSPPGQFGEMVADVKKLVPATLLDDGKLRAIARAYNQASARLITAEGGALLVVPEEGNVDETHCLQPATGKVFKVDHIAGTATEATNEAASTQGLLNAAIEEERKAVQSAVGEYCTSHFAEGRSASAVYGKDQTVSVHISGEHNNLRNWWSGSWYGHYTVQVGDGKATFKGTIKVRGHYFESGNMQLQSTKAVQEQTLSYSDATALGKAIGAAIKGAEESQHKTLESMYDGVSEEGLRKLRRPKPVMATKFSWNIAQIRMRNTLNSIKK